MLRVINLGIHFLLELCALGSVVYWGFSTGGGWGMKLVLGLLLPTLLAVIWGVFRVPNDPGPAPVAVSGTVRIVIEFGVFAFATWCLAAAGKPALAWAFGAIAVVNYALMYERLLRILK